MFFRSSYHTPTVRRPGDTLSMDTVSGERHPAASSVGVSGIAVAFKIDSCMNTSEWTIIAYTVLEFDRLGIIFTEALAIMHAFGIAFAKVIHDDGTEAKA